MSNLFPLCEQVQQEWMDTFDGAAVSLPAALATHLEECAECRAFVASTTALRREIRRLPVSHGDAAADHVLLARLAEAPRGTLVGALGDRPLTGAEPNGLAVCYRSSACARRAWAAAAVALVGLGVAAVARWSGIGEPRVPENARILVSQPAAKSREDPAKRVDRVTGQIRRSVIPSLRGGGAALWPRSGQRRGPGPGRLGPRLDSPESRLAGFHPGVVGEANDYSSQARNDGLPRHLTHPAAGAAAAPDPQRIQDDIAHLNRDPSVAMRRWAPLSPDAWGTIEQRVRRAVSVHDDFVRIPFPRIAAISAAPIVAAIQSYKQEAAVVDARLSREVTLQEKATALSDLCDRLRRDTGVYLSAGQSVADEKVTLFCEKVPLRDVMRQLSRPFGYSWTRSGKAGEYRYELVQDLRSQLMEEELRNRDRNEALLALEREIEAFRPYLGLLPDEALARSKTATSAAEKRLFERLGSRGWGPLQMYFRLSAQDLAQLRAGRTLAFSQDPRPGEQPLPPDLARGVIQSLRNWRLVRTERGFRAHTDASDPRGMPLSAVSEVRAQIRVEMRQSELGRFTLGGTSGAFTPRGLGDGFGTFDGDPPVASGTSAAAAKPKPGRARTGQAPDPALRRRVTLEPRPSTRTVADRRAQDPPAPEPRVTSADVLEALHRATKLPIVSDYYTHLYPPTTGSVREMPLADALDRIAEAMRLRWAREDGWLQFRSVTFYDDRLKEVPNRLLDRWATARKRQEMLSLEDLVEIARLSDAQLDADAMAEGARSIYGLLEWDLAREWPLRSHIRFLGEFTPEQRQQATRPAGLAFAAMSLAQQQQYLARALPERARPLQSLDELSGAVLRVDYSQPGWFQWRPPGPEWFKWALPIVPGLEGTRAPTAPLRERTREAALAAARSVAAGTRETMLAIARKMDPRAETSALLPDMSQIAPTRLDLEIIYIPGTANRRPVHIIRTDQDLNTGTG